MARTDAEKVQYAIDLIREAQEGGLVDAATAQRHLRELGVEELAATVTVTAQVRGDLDQLRNGNGEVTRQIEQTLGGLARQVGVTVVAGSVRLNVDGEVPTPAPAAPAPARPEPWRPQAAQAADNRGQAVSITLGWGGRLPAEGRQVVEDRLVRLGQQVGVNVVPGSVAITNPGGGIATIQLRATGVAAIAARRAEVERAVEQALTALARDNGIEAPRPGSVRVTV
jgi:hypothetical protein